ncbi:glutathione S-transferase family protein [Ferrovibrio sp. MS7]|uniref:glutathione S-transferase family protein n=1 Tax=Ferrovibrio plantarum TaxID=3119164 RepID=UPI0031376A45
MKFYDLKNGMNPRRVRIFMAEKGIKLETVVLDMEAGDNRTPEFLAKNPLGTLPLLELDDGTILTESLAICRYLEELQPEPPLFGTTMLERAQVEMWTRRLEHEVAIPATNVFRHIHPYWVGRAEQYGDYGQFSQQYLAARMAWLDEELAGKEYFVGDRYSIADITGQCAFLLARACKQAIPAELQNLTAWYGRVTSRPTARA